MGEFSICNMLDLIVHVSNADHLDAWAGQPREIAFHGQNNKSPPENLHKLEVVAVYRSMDPGLNIRTGK